jgi:hypothetical protein
MKFIFDRIIILLLDLLFKPVINRVYFIKILQGGKNHKVLFSNDGGEGALTLDSYLTDY